MELYTDIYYVERVLAGDTSCFACLLDRYSTQVHSLIVRVVQSQEDAEELTQDVFMKVYKSLSSFKGNSSFSTWLYRIAYNTAISEARKKKQEFLAIEEAQIVNISEEEIELAFGRTDNASNIRKLERALDMLAPDDRFIILLFYMEDKTVEDVSSITGLTVSNVKTKLHRIRKQLLVIINKMEEE